MGYTREQQREYLKNRRREHKIRVVEYYGNQCHDCKTQYEPCVYDLHHIDPTEKEFGLAQYLDRRWEKIQVELKKCVMLCANCHRKRHLSLNKENHGI